MPSYNFTSSVTFILIVLNVGASLIALYGTPHLLDKGMLRPYRVLRDHTWYELFTSGFLHAGIGHLFFNMFTLYFFGKILERILGAGNFLGLYLSALIISSIPSLIKFRNDPSYATLGASGAVGGVVFAFIFLFPFQDIYIFIIPVGIPAIIFGILFLIYSIFASNRGSGRVNHEAHIGGAVWGIIYLILFVPHAWQHFLRAVGLS